MPDQVIDVILQFRPAHLQFFNLLIGRKINFFFDAVNRVVQAVIFVEHFPEMVIRAFQPSDDVSMFRKLSEDWMMKVHVVVSSCLLI